MILASYRDAKVHSVAELHPIYTKWNANPKQGGWTGFDILEAQMRRGDIMAEHPAVEPRDAYQRAAYHRLQNLAPQLGYERRPPAPFGLGLLHLHFEKAGEAAAPWPTPDDITEDVA